ncbi:terminase small subunit [Citrobacter sp. ANG330]|uniref:terminase small subunit n=1 Tax=Citrobacter sp. ANG330 TaxID=3048142 RepID=UPI0039C12C83
MSEIVGIKANRAELSSIWGVSLPTITSWINAGCPYVVKGSKSRAWVFDTAAVAQWREDHKVKAATGQTTLTEDELKLRKLEAETVMAELELAKARGDVAPLELMSGMMSHVFAQVRAGIRNLPTRCVSQLIGESDPRKFKQVMLMEIDIVLEELAKADLTDGYTEGDSNGGDGDPQ